MELELKHLAGYLPYELRAFNKFIGIELYRTIEASNIMSFLDKSILAKPILRPLLDLEKEKQIAEYYMTYKNHLKRIFPSETIGLNIATWSSRSVEWLLENHFDIHGLIDAGLAIDINTLEK
jgi:hypothetical protein